MADRATNQPKPLDLSDIEWEDRILPVDLLATPGQGREVRIPATVIEALRLGWPVRTDGKALRIEGLGPLVPDATTT